MTNTTDAKSEDKARDVRPFNSDEFELNSNDLEAIVGGVVYGAGPWCGTRPPGHHFK